VPRKSATVYRFPVFLKEEDWQYLISGWEARRRRLRSVKSLARYSTIDRELSGSTADAYADGEEMKYVVYLPVEDFKYVEDSLRFVPVMSRDRDAVDRIGHEIAGAHGDATPWDGEG
jgi:hypothetical protein